ncbi:hypothetical protein B0A48_13922 [Cryoendolithus antarcticus]|uniref:Uncharacterized protein n=1 Tax=Cryoendolithus antarcticus TaxID=1507870 RepID=A0A1V8SLU5_9PEZI|nr:hypothetical protein B0A48_13922 [Cryoendolithus antarcticus]
MANAHHILDLNWEDLFDFEAWDHDTNVEVGQQVPASASPEHIEEELLGTGNQHTAEVTGQTSASGPGLDLDADAADLGLPAETFGFGDHEMTMTDVGALQSLPDQTFPSTSGMESSAFGQASPQPGEVQDFQMPLEALTLARAGLLYSSSALQSNTYRLGSAAAIRRSGAVQLEDDYDDIAAVKQSAKQWVKRMLWVYDEAVPYQVPADMTPDLYHAVQRYCC